MNKGKGFTKSFVVDRSPEEVFAAVNDVRGWWSEEIEGKTDRLGARFVFRYKKLHRSTHEITEFVPGKKVVWHIVDAKKTELHPYTSAARIVGRTLSYTSNGIV